MADDDVRIPRSTLLLWAIMVFRAVTLMSTGQHVDAFEVLVGLHRAIERAYFIEKD
jgi:hypothetical protein